MKKIKVLFVCSGNICRSPLAHRLFERIVEESNNNNNKAIEVDSCGIGAWHEGENADARMRDTAKARGWTLEKYARAFRNSDIDDFDYLIAMDSSHLNFMKRLMPKQLPNQMPDQIPDQKKAPTEIEKKLFLMRDFDTEKTSSDVPDPYYGGINGFEDVYDMIERSCKRLYEHINA